MKVCCHQAATSAFKHFYDTNAATEPKDLSGGLHNTGRPGKPADPIASTKASTRAILHKGKKLEALPEAGPDLSIFASSAT